MSAVEIAYVDPSLMVIDTDQFTIPAGTIAVVPHIPDDEMDNPSYMIPDEREEGLDRDSRIPPYTILAMEQMLDRELYPELSQVYPGTGGFYKMLLPNLRRRFIIGINTETGEILWGDGVIYYQTVPLPKKPVRDIRSAA